MDRITVATNVLLVVDPKASRPVYKNGSLVVPPHCEAVAHAWLKDYVDGLRTLYSVIVAVRNIDKAYKEQMRENKDA